MIGNDLLAKISGFGLFYRWHPAIAIRYLPLVKKIKETKNAGNILEVGSGGLGITPYLGRKATGVDLEFEPPYHPLLTRVKGEATDLPFGDREFDIVLSVDMLEHLPQKDREKAIREMIRVARRKVFIGVPSGQKSEEEDKIMHDYYRKKFGKDYKFFKEQIKERLPNKDIMLEMINRSAKQTKKEIIVKIEGNENISLHRFLMKGWMTKNILINLFFRKILLFAVPFFGIFEKPPFYRQLFFVEII